MVEELLARHCTKGRETLWSGLPVLWTLSAQNATRICQGFFTMTAIRFVRWGFGLALLAFQVGAIVHARFVPERYFCWAPFDQQTDYRLEATVNGRNLTPGEISQRYRRSARGTDNRSYQHIIDIVQRTEQQYHSDDRVEVVLTYRINGRQEQQWRYQQP